MLKETDELNHLKSQKGISLFLTMTVLTIMAVIAYGLVALSEVHSRGTREKFNSNKAYGLARMGISRAMGELKNDEWWGTDGSHSFDFDDGSYTVSVWAPQSNLNNDIKTWKVTSMGQYKLNTRKLEAWVQNESFARFSYFTNVEKAGTATIWFTDLDILKGSVHTNGYFSIYKNPQCSSPMTSHNKDDSCMDSSSGIYTQGINMTSDPAKFYHYYSNYGQDSPKALDDSRNFYFAGGQPEIPLPDNTDNLENRASYSFTGDMEFTFLETGNVEVSMLGRSEKQVLLADNLTVFVDGDVILKGGILKGKATLGCSGDIKIEDSVVYKDKSSDVLGLVARNDIVLDTDYNTQRDIEINAVLMALNGSFYVNEYYLGIPRGNLKIFGGLIQYSRGPLGTFNSSTGQAVSGYLKNYEYDKKLLNTPPPNYPTTGNLKIISFRDYSSIGE